MKNGLVDLKEELIEDSREELTDFDEELEALERNKKHFREKKQYNETQKPYPDVHPYDTADYDEIEDLQRKKSRNREYEERATVWDQFIRSDNPYVGRIDWSTSNGDFYIIENERFYNFNDGEIITYYIYKGYLETPVDNDPKLRFINAKDQKYHGIVKAWRSDRHENDKVILNRMITIDKGILKEVYTKYQKGNDELNKIHNSFLRKVLLENKNKKELQSIVQTIQDNQDEIIVAPFKNSFAVQGCAGSGKTIVLLHRIENIFYNNKELNKSNYSIITPSQLFIDYISKISVEFGILKDNLFSHKSYYGKILGDKTKITDKNEAMLDEGFLNNVYSNRYIKDCYYSVIDKIGDTLEQIVKTYQDELQLKKNSAEFSNYEKNISTIENDKSRLEDDFKTRYNSIIKAINDANLKYYEGDLSIVNINKKYINEEFSNEKQKLSSYIEEVSKIDSESINEKEKYYKQQLDLLNHEISDIKTKLDKGNIFTSGIFKRRLNKLQNEYNNLTKEYENNVLNTRKRQKDLIDNIEKIKNYYHGNITISSITSNLIIMDSLIDEYNRKSKENNDKLLTTQEKFKKMDVECKAIEDKINKYKKIDLSSFEDTIEKLEPLSEEQRDLIKDIWNETNLKIKNTIFYNVKGSELFSSFRNKTMGKSAAEYCKKHNIKDYADYKFWLFNQSYFKYLIEGKSKEPDKFIYIDEAQDLNENEIEFIHNYNDGCSINLFGDIHQVVNDHGIQDWNKLPMISKVYELNDNFRNTNQIIDYCNNFLPFKMTAVGVEGDEVIEVDDFSEINTQNSDEEIFVIVKNENLAQLLEKKLMFTRKKYKIYTVVESKGLEFYTVYVLKQDMNLNEFYIACTRALSKLIVIKKSIQ